MSQPGARVFGAGRFFGINNVANPTPMRAVTPQDMSIDFKRATKSLFGENQLAADVAAGEMTVTGKVTMGGLNARLFSDLLFGDAGVTGSILEADNEAGTVPGTSTYIVTVTNSATWTTDLGVYNLTTGKRMTRVATSPATNQYSVAAGVYTFASANASANVQISYLWTSASAGEQLTLSNQLQGPTGAFTAVMAFLYGNLNQDILTMNNVIASDSGIAAKGGDYAKPTFGFECATDTNDNLGTFSFAQAA